MLVLPVDSTSGSVAPSDWALRSSALWIVAILAPAAAAPDWADDTLPADFSVAEARQRLDVAVRALGRWTTSQGDQTPSEPALRANGLSPHHQAALLELAATVKTDVDAAVARLMRTVSQVLGVARASFWSWHDAPPRIRCECLYESSTGATSRGLELLSADYGPYFTAMRETPLIDASDAQTDPRTFCFTESYLRPLGITSMLDSPVWTQGQFAGVLCAEHVGPARHWSDAEQRFLLSVSQLVSLILEIDTRRRLETRLAASEERFQQFAESARELLWSVDAEGVWTFANDAAIRRLMGVSAESVLGRPFVELTGSVHRHAVLSWLVRLLNDESPPPLELVHRRPDGAHVPLRLSGVAVHDDRGRIRGATGTAAELSGVHEANAGVTRFRSMLDQAAEAILIVRSSDAVLVDTNHRADRWFELGAGRGLGRGDTTSLIGLGLCGDPLADGPTTFQHIVASLQETGAPVLRPGIWLNLPSQVRLAADISFTLHRMDAEDLIVVVLRDVTERMDREMLLELSQFALDSATDAYFRMDVSGRIRDCNQAACRALGYPRDALLGLAFVDLEPPSDARPWDERWHDIQTQGAKLFPTTLRRQDGGMVPVELSAAIFSFHGVQHVCAFARDISQRMESERALRERDDRLRHLIGSIPGVVYRARIWPDGRATFEFLSERAMSFLGIPVVVQGQPEEMPWERVIEEDRAATQESVRRAAVEQQPWAHEFRVSSEGGQFRWIRADSLLESAAEDGSTAWNGVFTDITERKRLEAQVQLASNLAAVGTLAAGVAHEINNPLSYVSGNLSYVRDTLEAAAAEWPSRDRTEVLRAVREAADGARRVASIVSDLKAFSRTQDHPVTSVDLDAALDVALRMTATQFKYRCRLVDARTRCPPVLAQEGRLAQVLVNLIINALEAMHPDRSPDENEICIRTWTEDHTIGIEVEDNGVGMSPETLRRAFDPFYTTKSPGGGTGLGLSVCHAIIQAAGGRLIADSVLGQGTRVTIHLPVADRIPSGTTPLPHVPSPGTSRRRVLFVDDDPPVLTAVQRLLSRDHDVTTLGSAREALALLRDGVRFDVIITDLMMPDLDGAEFYRAVAAELPEILPRVYLTTGGAYTDAMQAFTEEVSDRLIDKATDLPRLRDLVRTLG